MGFQIWNSLENKWSFGFDPQFSSVSSVVCAGGWFLIISTKSSI